MSIQRSVIPALCAFALISVTASALLCGGSRFPNERHGNAGFNNPAQHLAMRFSASGAVLQWRNNPDDHLAMRLLAYRTARDTRKINVTMPVVHANRAVLTHDHGITEWYLNTPLGIEQGFTVAASQNNRTPVNSITLVLAMQGNVQPVMKNNALVFKDKTGNKVLHYAGLIAYDAHHHRLPAQMSLESHRLLLSVNTIGAQFPVVLDPLFSAMTAFADPGSPQTEFDFYGSAMALSSDGSTALVGALSLPSTDTRGDGTVFAYARSNGVWTLTATIRNPNPADSDGDGNADDDDFGDAISLSADGNTALIGTGTGVTGSGYYDPGAAYIFTKTGGTWSTTPIATFRDPVPGDGEALLGGSVSLSADGTVALVGAHGTTVNGQYEAGAAYVYAETGGVWSTTPVATFNDPTAAYEDEFGSSVALSGDGKTAVVNAPDAVVTSSSNGFVYLYTNTNGTWSTTPVSTFTDPTGVADYGAAIALSSDGSTLLVNANDNNGSVVYSYTNNSGAWSTTPSGTITAPANGPHGGDSYGFGNSIAVSGDGNRALIGEPSAGNDPQPDSAAYLYVRNNGTWSDTPATLVDAGTVWGAFGETLALSGDGSTAIVGAERTPIGNDNTKAQGAGAAYFYDSLSVTPVDLSVALASNPASVASGESFSDLLTVTNTDSKADDSGLILRIEIPANTTFVSADADGGTCTNDTDTLTVTCTLDTLAANTDWKPTINLTAPASGVEFDTLDSDATLNAAEPDPDTSNNTASVSTTNSASQSSGSGGDSGSGSGSSSGGALSLLGLLALGLLWLGKSRRDK